MKFRQFRNARKENMFVNTTEESAEAAAPLVAVAVIAAELGITADDLAEQLGAHVVLDSAGCRAIPVTVARAHIFAELEREAADVDRVKLERQAAANVPNPVRERVLALGRAAERERLESAVTNVGAP